MRRASVSETRTLIWRIGRPAMVRPAFGVKPCMGSATPGKGRQYPMLLARRARPAAIKASPARAFITVVGLLSSRLRLTASLPMRVLIPVSPLPFLAIT
jgi:hypothetical protein